MRFLKASLTILSGLLVSPLIVLTWMESLWGGERIFVSSSQLLSLVSDLPGHYFRAAFYWATLKHCSWEVHIGFGSVFSHRQVQVKRFASLGNYCVIGHASIGEGAMIGSRVSIPSGKSQHLDEGGQLTRNANTFSVVNIGDGCWIGEAAVIMADIGQQSLIAAGSIAVNPIPDGVIAAGNPAKVLKTLSDG